MSHVAASGFVKDLVEHALHRNKRINGTPAPSHHTVFNTLKGGYMTNMNSGCDQEILVQS